MRSGISARHGGHQVAQKLTSTTLPRKSLEEIVRPSRSVTVKSPTGVGSLRSCTTPGSFDDSTGTPSGGVVPFEQATTLISQQSAANIHRFPTRVPCIVFRGTQNRS